MLRSSLPKIEFPQPVKAAGERCLPKANRGPLTAAREHAATTASKRADTAKGSQRSPQPRAAREKAAAGPRGGAGLPRGGQHAPRRAGATAEDEPLAKVRLQAPGARGPVGHEAGGS